MTTSAFDRDLNLEATELRLGLPGTSKGSEKQTPTTATATAAATTTTANKRAASRDDTNTTQESAPPPTKTQVVGWPPIRSYRKNSLATQKSTTDEPEVSGIFVKVSMDGAPYLRKIDLNIYKAYPELLRALEDMFKFKVGEYSEREGYNGSEYVPTYEDKDGDWMLVGDVPWDMFINSCKRLRIMKGSEARGLGCAL
ncbi:hypothetical protein LWI28_004856 [Acer negundo]|uniref:Auxin-responsive protein n=1 Tax=Acer negundo TaxID=4023 RepID=A0AAD5NWG7_ACENE|nr:hypothetical protein LWI28_004856 [Acer negundo]KAK4852299.1 hypothetical protein QYF36_022773 [Acer negundo]